jgi:putative membrane protein
MRSEAGDELLDAPRRLHPFSWLFTLLLQLRSFAIPLLVLVATGRRGVSGEWLGLIGVVVMTVVSVIQYFTYRYETSTDGIVVTRGILQRTRRDIPYERIHTVNLHQNVLHRVLGVTDVRLESAGSKEPEAVMRVLSLPAARELEDLIRERGAAARRVTVPTIGAAIEIEGEAGPLFALDTAEVVRLGLISNRGMVAVAAAAGLVTQVLTEADIFEWEELRPDFLIRFLNTLNLASGTGPDYTVTLAIEVVLLLAVALAGVRLLSVVLALLQFHGFRLDELGSQLRVQRGLLTRVRHQLPRRRIQAWRIDETWLHRQFDRVTLRVDSATGADEKQGIRDLAPVASPEQAQGLIRYLAPHVTWPPHDWRPVDPRAWRRLFIRPAVVTLALTATAVWFVGAWALLLLVLVPWFAFRARRLAAGWGYYIDDTIVAVRQGWLSRRWAFIEIGKIQSVRLSSSPFDRRLGVVTLWIDSAGASGTDGVLRVRFLPDDEGRTIYERIAAQLEVRPRAA